MHSSNQTIIQQLTKHEDAKIDKINQTIHLSELIVTFKEREHSAGEYTRLSLHHSSLDRIERLKDQISLLATLANRYHIEKYCEEKEDSTELKPAYCNTITRISLNEFALYTHSDPLSLEEYAILTSHIRETASRCQDNLHLILGTVALKKDEFVLNMALYVECGSRVKLHTVTKFESHAEDPGYTELYNFSRDDKFDGTRTATFSLGEDSKSQAISQNPIFTCETVGGAQFLVCLEICFTHAKAHAQTILSDQLKLLASGERGYLPLQINHVIISNSIYLITENLTSSIVSHIDSDKELSCVYRKHPKPHLRSLESILSPEVKRTDFIKNSFYKTTFSTKEKGKLVVEKPPFGEDFYISYYKNVSLGFNTKDLVTLGTISDITAANKKAMLKKIHTMFKSFRGKSFVESELALLETSPIGIAIKS